MMHFRLYRLLEREDWHALARYLEHQVLERGRFSSLLVGLYANTALALSDFDALRTLEDRTARAKPALLEEYALLFGAARLLNRDYAGAERFFTARTASPPAEAAAGPPAAGQTKPPRRFFARGAAGDKEVWLRWYRGFALFLGCQYEKAADVFVSLARFSPEPVTTGLSAWLLTRSLVSALPEREAELTGAAETGRERTRALFAGGEAWEKAVQRRGADMYVVILSKYLREAAGWLFARGEVQYAQL
jgi:hypothetical protein